MSDSRNEEPVVPKDWYEDAFGAFYPVIYAHRTVESAAKEAAFAAAQTQLSSGDTLLDLCCGNGRHLAHLVPRAGRSVGVDYSPPLLRLAHCNAPGALLLRADMRALPFVEYFNVVVNFFTSFGYFTEDRDNRAVLSAMCQVLRPQGRYFLDYLNPVHVETELHPHTTRHLGKYRIEENRWIDRAARRVNKVTQVWLHGDCVAQTTESVRMYSLDEMEAMLVGAGLEIDRIFGDYDGASFFNDRPRMIIIGHRGRHGA